MTPEKCPGCGTKLQPDMMACPNCPMSFPEYEGPTRSSNPLAQSRYYHLIFPVIFFGALGAAIWYLGVGLMHLGRENNQVENGSLMLGETIKPAPPEPAAGRIASPSEEKPSDDEGMVVIAHGEEPSLMPAPVPVSSPPGTKSEWRLRGMVYDLTTLKPLPGCALQFTGAGTSRSYKTRTDSAGRYRAMVPSLSGGYGYAVTVEMSGYSPNYLDPGTEGVRAMDAGVRTGMARGLAATLTAAPSIIRAEGDKPLVTDFYLAPRL